MGYHQAGFDVVGVDIEPQPHYPFEFFQMDALEFLNPDWSAGNPPNWAALSFDAIHASPPCQRFTTMSNRHRGAGGVADARADLLTPVLALMTKLDLPWVVENVPGAQKLMPNPIRLHGGMFNLSVQRCRLFSASFPLSVTKHAKVKNPIGVYGNAPDGRRLFDRADGTTQRAASSLQQAQTAMGIDWADWRGVKEAIPPAYTKFIGKQLKSWLCHLAHQRRTNG